MTRRKRHTPSADWQFRQWLATENVKVGADIVLPWVTTIVADHDGNVTRAAENARVDPETMRRLVKGLRSSVSIDTAELIATAAGKVLALHVPPPGADDWSEAGRYCGDGAGLWDGCGTFFHPAHVGGLCEECYGREVLGVGPTLPRDVRVTRELREVQCVDAFGRQAFGAA